MKSLIGVAVLAVVGAASPCAADVVWWSVPAMSGAQRLPDAVPADGERGGTVRIVAARGEYEPGSFVVRSDADLGKVRPVVGTLTNENGVAFPAEGLDLRVVKVWFQNRNGWFSYFADSGAKLCPELLLHDEDLIRVDREKGANYARITAADGKTFEWWLNPPRKLNGRYFDHWVETTAFPSMKPGFADASSIRPVALPANESKQFVLTAYVAPDVPAGIYRGSISIGQSCSVPVALRVLDFELPKPKAYVHPEMDFPVCFYSYVDRGHILALNGGDEALMWRQMEAIMRNAVRHGQDMKWLPSKAGNAETEHVIALMKKVGMRTDMFVGGVDTVWQERDGEKAGARAKRIADYYDRKYGHHNLYAAYGDEPGGMFFPQNRVVFDSYQAAGLKFIIAAGRHIVPQVGYKWDWHNSSSNPADPTLPTLWNQMGTDTRCAWYANQHVGAENPEFSRRQNGLMPYLNGYSALCNYAHHLGPYNDDSETYKPMVYAYGTADGVIDTLQWEGFREGIDDIRYATLMLGLAREADKSSDLKVRQLGRKAKLLLALFERETGDLDAVRGEMIGFIERLRTALGGKTPGPEPAKELVQDFSYGEPPARPWKFEDAAFNGAWEEVRRFADTNTAWTFKTAQYAAQAYYEAGNAKRVREACDLGLAVAKKPEDVYFLKMAKRVLVIRDQGAGIRERAVAEADREFGKGLEAKTRKERLERLGSFAMCANDETLVRGIAAYLKTAFPSKPDKTYVVKFSPFRILGPGNWSAVAADVRPGKEFLDRGYGGDASVLDTDVATGRGTVNADSQKHYGRDPAWEAMADEWGIHFRLVVFDEMAAEIAAGLKSAGTLEGYLAPGANTPYLCLLHTFAPGGLSIYNSGYDQRDFRGFDAKDRANCREDVWYGKDTLVVYWAFSWAKFATCVPTSDSVWEFEPVLWGRKENRSWNGLKTIHGRSSWGRLRFDIPDAGRRQIIRALLFRARRDYEAEKTCYGAQDGVLAHWQNEEVGDPAFYESVLKPVVERLDAAAAKVAFEMDDATVDELERAALPSWYNFKFDVQRLRADYLRKGLIP